MSEDVKVLDQWESSHLMTVKVWVPCATTACRRRGDSHFFFANGDLQRGDFMERPVPESFSTPSILQRNLLKGKGG